MEYEIGGEQRLFDDSTNPSLQQGEDAAREIPAVRRKRPYNSDDKIRQRGVPIPEEDTDTQMG